MYIPVKEEGRIGIPTIVIDDEVMLELDDEKIEEIARFGLR